MYFRAARQGFFHSRSRQETGELPFERQVQSSLARRWLRAAVAGKVDIMHEIVREDPKIIAVADNFTGCVARK